MNRDIEDPEKAIVMIRDISAMNSISVPQCDLLTAIETIKTMRMHLHLGYCPDDWTLRQEK